MGAWLSYGLGSDNKNFPVFCVLLSKGKGNGQGVYSKLWSNGFLDSIHQGVQFTNGENPVLYLSDPDGMDRVSRRKMLDELAAINSEPYKEFGHPATNTNIHQPQTPYPTHTPLPQQPY